MEQEDHDMTSLKTRRGKNSPLATISCCISGTAKHLRRASFDAASASLSPLKSPSAWFRSKKTTAVNNESPESTVKDKRRRNNFISRISRHRRHSSADFTYDPLSYALNFDDDQIPYSPRDPMSFTARLPVSPPGTSADTTSSSSAPTPAAISSQEGSPNHDLRRGFDALGISTKRSAGGSHVNYGAPTPPDQRRNNKAALSSPRAAAVAEVKRSLEADHQEVTNSSNRQILVHLG